MAIDLFYDIDSPDYRLPLSSYYGGYQCNYRFDKDEGFFVDDIQALVQVKFRGMRFTLTIGNTGGFLSPITAYYRFTTPEFNDFNIAVFESLPQEIKNRFPCLSLMANPVREDSITKKLVYDIIPRMNFSFNDSKYTDRSLFGMSDWLALDGKSLSNEQISGIGEACEFIVKARKEYKAFKASRLYRVIQDKIKQKSESSAVSILMLFKLAKLGLSLYNGFSSSDDAVGWDQSDFSGWDNESMADFVCADAYDSYDGHDISFTGSDDKYSDNQYNRQQADKWLAKMQDCLAKGDTAGAKAAEKLADKHLGRIKN